MQEGRALKLGAFAPWFVAPTDVNATFHFHTVGGRWIVLALMHDAKTGDALLRSVRGPRRALFDDMNASFFGVSRNSDDDAILRTEAPGLRFFRDPTASVHTLFGAHAQPIVFLIDPALRIDAAAPLQACEAVFEKLERRLGETNPQHAPVLVAPRIFEPDLCQALIAHYRQGQAEPSGFMRERNGITIRVHDTAHKSRSDVQIDDEKLRAACQERVRARLIPMIERAWNWRATRMERYIVARYSAEDGGHFNPHRDNTTKGTAHRRFAVTINLNAEDYEGGDLRFPEYGARTYRAPTGGAVVFGCSVLHECTLVTRGERFAFLPFLYDEAGAEIRERNAQFLESDGDAPYKK
jgi:predicted 2-oxoglutarate/Fe(II)-dependent dioxygenase YbiX